MNTTATASDTALATFLETPFAHPERTAIIDNGTLITYGELDERIRIKERDIASAAALSGLVGVAASRNADTMVSMLATLRSGATYCPIDVALPAARQQALRSRLGLSGTGPDGTRSKGDKSSAADATDQPLTRISAPDWRPAGRDENPAYVLFTSGSTGNPKPVPIPRRALAAAVPALRTLFGLTPRDRVLQFAAPSWDTALEEMLPAVAAGAAVVFDDHAYRGAFPQFLRAISRRRVTVLNLSTAWWHELVRHLSEENTPLPGCVRLVVIGGEPVNPGLLRAWRVLPTGHARLLNTYGCTETAMITHAIQLSGPGVHWTLPESSRKVPLGMALPHVRDHLTPAGELWVSGVNLALGYLGMPEQTAASFAIDDLGTGPARWFHTGDLMQRGDDRLLYPVGRVDDQLKVRGARVHPIEVEAVLGTHPAVAATAVCGEHSSGRTALIAYVVLRGTASVTELRRYVRERLPEHFVPHRVHPVAALCFTPTGKIDRAATHHRFATTASGAGE